MGESETYGNRNDGSSFPIAYRMYNKDWPNYFIRIQILYPEATRMLFGIIHFTQRRSQSIKLECRLTIFGNFCYATEIFSYSNNVVRFLGHVSGLSMFSQTFRIILRNLWFPCKSTNFPLFFLHCYFPPFYFSLKKCKKSCKNIQYMSAHID